MTLDELFDATGYNLADLRCMASADRSRLLDTWDLPVQFRTTVDFAVGERPPTRWERAKSKLRGAWRKTKRAVKATGRFLRNNWLRIAVGALIIVTTIVAWKAMLILAILTALFAAYFCWMAYGDHQPANDDDDKTKN